MKEEQHFWSNINNEKSGFLARELVGASILELTREIASYVLGCGDGVAIEGDENARGTSLCTRVPSR